jgi:hypothetical protein
MYVQTNGDNMRSRKRAHQFGLRKLLALLLAAAKEVKVVVGLVMYCPEYVPATNAAMLRNDSPWQKSDALLHQFLGLLNLHREQQIVISGRAQLQQS